MTTEVFNVVVREDGSRVVKRNLEDIGRAGSGAAGGINILKAALGGLAALGVGAIFQRAISAAGAFQTKMAEVSTLVDTTTFKMQDLTTAIKSQSLAFGQASTEQAAAAYQIISAGASDAASAIRILDTANRLAIGGVTDVATAADGLTSVLNAYGDQVAGAEAVSDALFVGMRAGKTTIEELASSLGKVAPLAAQAGTSFDELVAGVAALTKGGIKTTEAVTGMRAIMAAVVKPTKEAADLSQRLGLEFNAAALKSKGFSAFLDDLVEKTGGSTDQLALLFGGVEALVPALALAGQAGKDFDTIMGDMGNKVGATDEAFKKMTDTLEFQAGRVWQGLTNELINFGTVVGTSITPALRSIADNFELIVASAKSLAFVITSVLAVSLAKTLVMAVSAAVGQMVALELALGATSVSAALLGGAFKTAALGVRALTVALASNPIGLLAIGLSAAISYLLFFKKSTNESEVAIDNATLAIGDEVKAVQTLTGVLNSGTITSVKAAEAKLLEAEARRENINRLIEEARQLVLASDAYRDTVSSIDNYRKTLEAIAAPGTELEDVPVRLRAAYVEAEAGLASALSRQQELLASANDHNQALRENQENIRRIREAIANAKDGMVNFNGEVVTTDELTQRLNKALNRSGDLIGDAANATGGLSNGLNVATAAAARLLGTLGQIPAAINSITTGVDNMVAGLASQNAELLYQVEQGVSAQVAQIKVARDEAIKLALAQGASIDQVAALGAAFDEQAAKAQLLIDNNKKLTDTLNPVIERTTATKKVKKELTEAEKALNEQLELQKRILEDGVGARTEFYNSMAAVQQLLADPTNGFGTTEAFGVLSNLFNEDVFANTQEAMNLQIEQVRLMYEQIDAMRQADLISEQTAQMAKAQANYQLIEQNLSSQRAFFGTLAGLARSENKKVAAIGKAAAITQATIDGYLAIQKALATYPPPGNFAIAAAIGAVTAANVASIAAQNTNFATGGSFMVPGSGGVDTQMVALRATPGERVTVQTPTQVRKGTAAANSGAGGSPSAPQVNFRAINVLDPALVGDYLSTPEGEQVLVNVIQSSGIMRNGS